MSRFTRMAAVAAIVGAALCSPVAAQAASDLIDAAPSRVAIEVPGPGKSVEWTMSVKNLTPDAQPVTVAVDGASNRLFAGPHPLELELVDVRSGDTLYAGTVQGALDGDIHVPDLPAGGSYDIAGSVRLDAAAGNAYQGASGRLLFEFRALADEPQVSGPRGTDLVETGSTLMLCAALAAVTVVAGVAVARKGRKTI